MKHARKAIFPGFLLGCLILIALGSIAARRMPPIQTPTATPQGTSQQTPTASPTREVTQPEADVGAQAASAADHATEAPEASTQTPPAPSPVAPTETATQASGTEAESQNCSLNPGLPQDVRQWCGLIESFAEEYGMPAGLIAVVIMQESYGDPLAYSKSGAVGLMQVMPRDGLAAEFLCNGNPCFADRPTIEELQDPAFNINYGTRMLANLYSKHGSYREALFRYGPINMGYRYADIVLGLWESYP